MAKYLVMDVKSVVVSSAGLKVVEAAQAKPAPNAINEISSAVFQEFLGISQPSIKTCDTLKAKYAKMVVDVHGCAKKPRGALDGQQKLKKEFLTEAAKKPKAHPTADKAGQLKKPDAQFDEEMAKGGMVIMDRIGEIHALYADIKVWAPTVGKLPAQVKALKVFREALKFLVLATSIFDGNKIVVSAKNLGMGIVTAGRLYV